MEDKDIKEMVTEMHKALLGDQYRKEGYLSKIDRIEGTVSKHSIYWKVLFALAAVVGFVVAIVKDIFSIFT